MRMTLQPKSGSYWIIGKACTRCALPPPVFLRRIAVRRPERWRSSVKLWRLEQWIDLFQIGFAERSDSGFQLELRKQRVKTCSRQIAPGHINLLLGIEHIDNDAHAHIEAQLVRFERADARNQRRIQSPANMQPAR